MKVRIKFMDFLAFDFIPLLLARGSKTEREEEQEQEKRKKINDVFACRAALDVFPH